MHAPDDVPPAPETSRSPETPINKKSPLPLVSVLLLGYFILIFLFGDVFPYTRTHRLGATSSSIRGPALSDVRGRHKIHSNIAMPDSQTLLEKCPPTLTTRPEDPWGQQRSTHCKHPTQAWNSLWYDLFLSSAPRPSVTRFNEGLEPAVLASPPQALWFPNTLPLPGVPSSSSCILLSSTSICPIIFPTWPSTPTRDYE